MEKINIAANSGGLGINPTFVSGTNNSFIKKNKIASKTIKEMFNISQKIIIITIFKNVFIFVSPKYCNSLFFIKGNSNF